MHSYNGAIFIHEVYFYICHLGSFPIIFNLVTTKAFLKPPATSLYCYYNKTVFHFKGQSLALRPIP